MNQEVLKIERSIKNRRDTDLKLVDYWLYIFLLSGVTLGIYPLVLFVKRINRVDGFIKRKGIYYNGVIEFTEKKANELGVYEDYHNEIKDLKSFVKDSFSEEIKEINGLKSFLLTIVTCGLYGGFVTYKMNKVWNDLQLFEQDFNDKLNQLWLKLELTKYPIDFKVDSSKNRNFLMNLGLSVLTFGFWSIVWDYKLHTDPDNLYPEFHAVEDVVLSVVRQ